MSTSHQVIEKDIQRSAQDKTGILKILQRALPNRVTSTANQTNSADTLANATELVLDKNMSFGGDKALEGGKSYYVKGFFALSVDTDAQLSLGGGSASIDTSKTNLLWNSFSTTASPGPIQQKSDTAGITLYPTDTPQFVTVEGYLKCTSSGSLIPKFGPITDMAPVILLAGSFLEVQEVLT